MYERREMNVTFEEGVAEGVKKAFCVENSSVFWYISMYIHVCV